LRWHFGPKAIISDPDAFKDKVRQLQRMEGNKLKRANSGITVSEFSMYTKSQKTGLSLRTESDAATDAGGPREN
jgi:hypothetical protein